MDIQFLKRPFPVMLFFAALAAALYTYAGIEVNLHGYYDFSVHAEFAQKVLHGAKLTPHFLYQLLLIGTHKLFGFSFSQASFLIVFLGVFCTFIIAWTALSEGILPKHRHLPLLAVCFLLFSHPITFLFFYDRHLLLGYIVSNIYHNPTFLLLRPIALLNFILLCMFLEPRSGKTPPASNLFLLALLTIFSILAKPNYMIALLPALAILFVIRRFITREDTSHWLWTLLGNVLLPSLLLLVWQFLTFYSPGNSSSFGIGFLDVFRTHSRPWTLFPKLVASLAFPVSVIVVMGRRLSKQLAFQLSAAMLGVSLIYAYCFWERVEGGGIYNGNFGWSGAVSLFLFLFVCLKAYLEELFNPAQRSSPSEWRDKIYLPAYVAGIHFVFGVVWYLSNTVPSFWKP